ncbi:hypothetical protein BDV19DRAFT_395064 [Aspergillus venezuelensis]
MVKVTSVNGGLGVAGVYPPTVYSPTTSNGHQNIFPVSSGQLWTKALQLNSGAVSPMYTAPRLQDLIETGVARPSFIVSSEIGIEEVPEAYSRFHEHREYKGVIHFA